MRKQIRTSCSAVILCNYKKCVFDSRDTQNIENQTPEDCFPVTISIATGREFSRTANREVEEDDCVEQSGFEPVLRENYDVSWDAQLAD